MVLGLRLINKFKVKQIRYLGDVNICFSENISRNGYLLKEVYVGGLERYYVLELDVVYELRFV